MWGLWGATGGAASASSHPVPSPDIAYSGLCTVLCRTVVTTTSQYISHGCVAAPAPGLLLIKLCWHWRMEQWVSLVRAGTLVTRTCRSEDTGTPHNFTSRYRVQIYNEWRPGTEWCQRWARGELTGCLVTLCAKEIYIFSGKVGHCPRTTGIFTRMARRYNWLLLLSQEQNTTWIFFPSVIHVFPAGVHKKRHFGDQGAKTPQIHFAGMLQEETGIILMGGLG